MIEMMEKQTQQKINDVLNLSLLIEDKKDLVKHQTEQLNTLKKEVRDLMKELGEKKLEDELVEVEMRISNSFDVGILGVYHPELYKKYVTTEKVIRETEEMTIDKKGLEKDYPTEYKACLVENTPGLYIKRRRRK